MKLQTQFNGIIKRLRKYRNPAAIAGMARFGIVSKNTYGVTMPVLRSIFHEVGKNHPLALKLYANPCRETRILASMLAEPGQMKAADLERWVKKFDSWEVCDQCCMNLFRYTPMARKKAVEWSRRDEEFEKRAGYVLMATLAVSEKTAPDKDFEAFFPHIVRGSRDSRNYVKKAVSWALRQIGKRNSRLLARSRALARELRASDDSTARWIGADALADLSGR